MKSLDASDICRIIEHCDAHNVAMLKYGDLELRLGPKAEDVPDNPPPPIPGDDIPEPNHEKANRDALAENEQFLKEAQLEELKINDPLAYEEFLEKEGFDGKPSDNSEERDGAGEGE